MKPTANEMMKPRIRIWYGADGRAIIDTPSGRRVWICTTGVDYGLGATPLEAWVNWVNTLPCRFTFGS